METKKSKNLTNFGNNVYILVKVPKEYGICCNCHVCEMLGYKDNEEICMLKEQGVKKRCGDNEAYWYFYRDYFMWEREELLKMAVNALKTGENKDKVLEEIEKSHVITNRDMEWKVSDEEYAKLEEK